MEQLLLEFVDTLDQTMKKLHQDLGTVDGFTRLTIHQFQYIEAIHDLGEPTISEVAEKLKITKASVTVGLKKLIQAGYIFKRQSLEDKRVYHVRLTDISGRLISAKYQAVKEYGALVNSVLSAEEANQLENILTKIVRRFNKSDQNKTVI